MLTNLVYVFGSGLAIFLFGANSAFLFHMGRRLTHWFLFKIIAIDMLMIYMCLSLFIGDPGLARGLVGGAALVMDAVALLWMWGSVERMRQEGVIGLIPIARLGEPE